VKTSEQSNSHHLSRKGHGSPAKKADFLTEEEKANRRGKKK